MIRCYVRLFSIQLFLLCRCIRSGIPRALSIVVFSTNSIICTCCHNSTAQLKALKSKKNRITFMYIICHFFIVERFLQTQFADAQPFLFANILTNLEKNGAHNIVHCTHRTLHNATSFYSAVAPFYLL